MSARRKGTETGHHMSLRDVSTRLKKMPTYKTPVIKEHCQTCNQRENLLRHPVGLRVCAYCWVQINALLNQHGLQSNDLRQLPSSAKHHWIQMIDEMHLYESRK